MVLVEKFVAQSATAALLLCLTQRNELCDRANEIRGGRGGRWTRTYG